MIKIVLLDPSLKDNQGNPGLNLGDIIVFESVIEELQKIFPGAEIIRVSSHVVLERSHIQLIRESDFTFVGGTNILSSDAMAFRSMPLANSKWIYLFPPVKNLVLMGVGWGFGHGQPVKFKTRLLYKKIFDHKWVHACRDGYSTLKLSKSTSLKTINTCCPTTWQLKEVANYRSKKAPDCLLTLTDYKTDIVADTALIKILLDNFNRIFFFPQGTGDTDYLRSLEVYKNNSSKFELLSHDYLHFKTFIEANNSINFAGTRLHAGIKCMQYGINSLIIAVDNRAMDIFNDTNLPVIPRSEIRQVESWLNGEQLFEKVNLPSENIQKWRSQFM